jgi:hypothetical protein
MIKLFVRCSVYVSIKRKVNVTKRKCALKLIKSLIFETSHVDDEEKPHCSLRHISLTFYFGATETILKSIKIFQMKNIILYVIIVKGNGEFVYILIVSISDDVTQRS